MAILIGSTTHLLSSRALLTVGLGLGLFLSTRKASSEPASSDAELSAPLDRKTVVRAAVAHSPAVRAAQERAHAMQTEAKSEGSLPAPEIMGQVWQVPLSRPYALNNQMIMVGVTQSFPAPGSLAAREGAMNEQAQGEEAMARERGRQIAREAGHAFADYRESTAKHHIHQAHQALARHLLEVAEARHSAGGALTDVTKAEVELSRMEADVLTDATLVESAKAHINALLGRDPQAPLGRPADSEATLPRWTTPMLLAEAREKRPELRGAKAERSSRALLLRAAEREATWPSFSVGALYFPPTDAVPQHGYGASASMTLPWLWGGSSGRRAAQRGYLAAAESNLEAMRIPVDVEVVTTEAIARSAAVRLQVLEGRTLLASRRALDVAQAGYETGRTDLLTVLDAERSVVDVEDAIVSARSTLEHALTDLDAAVGLEVPQRPLEPLDLNVLGGGDHVR
jgi:cobalt-zinc-cadmium efflux system outer membrane protein